MEEENPNLLRWISAIVTGTGIGVSLYLYSPPPSSSSSSPSTYVVKSAMTFADWLTTTAHKLHKFYDGQPLSSSNFFIRDSMRRRIFFNYEKRLRTLSPPEKILQAL